MAVCLIQIWSCDVDGQYHNDNSRYDGPPKKEWVVQRFPIKGGGLIRSAMVVEQFYRPITWATVEGHVDA